MMHHFMNLQASENQPHVNFMCLHINYNLQCIYTVSHSNLCVWLIALTLSGILWTCVVTLGFFGINQD